MNPRYQVLDTLTVLCIAIQWFERIDNVQNVIEGADKVIQALSSHTGLRKLHLESVDIGIKGYTNLAAMLLSSSCSLSTLGLKDQSNIDDEIAKILSPGLNGNGTLTELDLSGSLRCTRLTAIGWQAIFEQLRPDLMVAVKNVGSGKS